MPALEHVTQDAGRLVAPLRAFGRDDLERAGGKGANLGELIRIGMPVPDGFVVTTDAYAAVDVPARDHASYEHAELPAPLARAVADAYAALGGGPVAVRSSATAEDLPGAAFAGQQDTYLNVVGEPALLDAVRRCWGSLWAERAVTYRARLGIDPDDVRIAVVVQRMIDPDAAGVMFTADPVTGDRGHVVVEAGAGLGEAVVSGLVTPDRYVLDRAAKLGQYTPGRNEVVVRATPGGGVSHDTAPVAGRLDDAVLDELVRLGGEVERHFGRPQDIEWAVESGRVHLLQARPMTALPPPPLARRLNPLQRRLTAVLMELLPTRPYPMDMSTWVPHGPAGLMAKVTESLGIRRAFEDFLREKDGVVYQLVPPRPHPLPRVLLAPFRVASRARRFDPARWTDDPRYGAYRERVRELAARDLTALSWAELVRVPREALDLVEPVTDLRIDYLPGSGVAVARLFLALRVSRSRIRLGDLMLDGRSRTEQANRDLEALAGTVRADRDLAERFATEEPAELLATAERMPQFAALIAEHGHRESASPLLASSPTWGEAPEIVVGLVKALATADAAPSERPRADAGLSPRLRRLVERARAGAAFREDSHYEFTRPLPILRAALHELGGRLAAAGVLDDAADIWHLRLEEIEDLDEPAAAGGRLRDAARARAARRDELAGVRLIDPRSVFPARDAGDALVAGEPASGGRVSGPVRIIREPAEFGRLANGDILVCPYTNPSWTPLFQRAAAVVVDSGGIASHAAIVAREYGIPAIMGTADGTAVLRDGQTVTVDGDTGRVTA
ncbi:PEP/pyruvate-binding domain-containing protein [Microbacterium cremeum]|uniref:PEP/pyruvate-binding domain-containing protein n=1 Tax=Microbacterium cremeum TaxID=2782169 RepID=UPI00188876E6|nr:PEP/pyruvate-binding domain-containing protein [Microbacterium cremeum]